MVNQSLIDLLKDENVVLANNKCYMIEFNNPTEKNYAEFYGKKYNLTEISDKSLFLMQETTRNSRTFNRERRIVEILYNTFENLIDGKDYVLTKEAFAKKIPQKPNDGKKLMINANIASLMSHIYELHKGKGDVSFYLGDNVYKLGAERKDLIKLLEKHTQTATEENQEDIIDRIINNGYHKNNYGIIVDNLGIYAYKKVPRFQITTSEGWQFSFPETKIALKVFMERSFLGFESPIIYEPYTHFLLPKTDLPKQNVCLGTNGSLYYSGIKFNFSKDWKDFPRKMFNFLNWSYNVFTSDGACNPFSWKKSRDPDLQKFRVK
jgi:hypothetical protein